MPALVLNLWVGYFPTVQTAWNQLTAGPLPDQTDLATVNAMAAKGAPAPARQPSCRWSSPTTRRTSSIAVNWSTCRRHGLPAIRRRRLPTVMMIGGEFNTPADWARAGNAVKTIDDLAATHDGNAPVFVFVDSGGAFNNDTECVNGSRGNAADHLTKDVVPYMISNFGVSAEPSQWGIVGWSMGGTCAVDLTVMHPDLFSAFVDIAGNMGPNAGTKAQTIARLFGGDADAWAAFDPATVIGRHGRYDGVSGWFDISSDNAPTASQCRAADAGAIGLGGQDAIATRTTRPPPPSRCANSAAPTASTARSSPSPASTTGLSRVGLSRRRCPGWRASWALPRCRGSRCRPRRIRPCRRRLHALSLSQVAT